MSSWRGGFVAYILEIDVDLARETMEVCSANRLVVDWGAATRVAVSCRWRHGIGGWSTFYLLGHCYMWFRFHRGMDGIAI